MNPKSLSPYAASALSGFFVCLGISIMSGRREAWDSPLYFTIGIPLMAVIAFALSYRYPERVWRWALAMAVGQSIAMTFRGGSLSLWPLSLIAMTVCSIPLFLCAWLGVWVRNRGE